MEKMIAWIIGHLPKPLQKLWYAHESVWMYILVGGLTTLVSLIFQMLPTALFTRMHMANWLNTGLSTTISWIFAVTFAFFTNKKYVFKSETHTRAAFGGNFTCFTEHDWSPIFWSLPLWSWATTFCHSSRRDHHMAFAAGKNRSADCDPDPELHLQQTGHFQKREDGAKIAHGSV